MRLSHTRPVVAATFDEPNLGSTAGLVPVMRLAEAAGLDGLAGALLSVPTDRGADPGRKVSALVAGMVAGADSIEDMALLRHGAMRRVFDQPYASSTLGHGAAPDHFMTHLAIWDGLADEQEGPETEWGEHVPDANTPPCSHEPSACSSGAPRWVRGPVPRPRTP
jgi:hypothetical protein